MCFADLLMMAAWFPAWLHAACLSGCHLRTNNISHIIVYNNNLYNIR